MSAPRLKCISAVARDDTMDGVARLRFDMSGNLWLDAEDLSALALMLANPPAVNHAAIMRQVREESDARRRAENLQRERDRIAAGAARAADVARLREQFPTLADRMFPPTDDSPAWHVFTAEGGQYAYLQRFGPVGPVHTADRLQAMRFVTREAAQAQAREMSMRGAQYLVEEPTT